MKPSNYAFLLNEVKEKIRVAQLKTVVAANSQMLLLYWQLGNFILTNQKAKGWGAQVIDKLAADLKKEFPGIKGFSSRNLKYMKKFAEDYNIAILNAFIGIERQIKDKDKMTQSLILKLLYADPEQFIIVQQPVALLGSPAEPKVQQPAALLEGASIVQQPAALLGGGTPIAQQPATLLEDTLFQQSILSKISWSHHMVLMNKERHLGKRLWYMLNTLEHGNSRNILSIQIESRLFERQIVAKKINNFERTLPKPQTDFANYMLKDPYIFDFVQAKESADERNIEEQLSTHITKFLLELGQGFAFMGRQVHFEIGDADFYADLLFYHTRLHCFVVVELKARPFEPGDASQLNFYVNVINDKMKTATDNDTIGLLLCRGKSDILAEYALKGYRNAIGVSDYQLSKAIPDNLKSQLPNIEDLERELEKESLDG